MNIWNTIATKQESALTQALFTLQTLSDEQSIPILDYLQEYEEASLLDLTVATRLHTSTIELQLELLCQTKIVRPRRSIYGNFFRLDQERLAKVLAIAKCLVKK